MNNYIKYKAMKKIILLCLCAVSLSSCFIYRLNHPSKDYTPDMIEATFAANMHTGIDSLIRIDGYYMLDADSIILKLGEESNYIFYDDGTVGNFMMKDPEDDYIKWENIDLGNAIARYKNGAYCFGSGYLLHNDTITRISFYSMLGATTLCKTRYKIINREPIRQVGYEESEGKKMIVHKPSYKEYMFVPTKNIPSSDYCWIRDRKDMWKDSTEWATNYERTKTVREEYTREHSSTKKKKRH